MMAIQVNQLNPYALSALAGQSVGRLDLPVAGIQPGLFQQAMAETTLKKQELMDQQANTQMDLYTTLLKEKGLNDRDAKDTARQIWLEQYKQQNENARLEYQEKGLNQRADQTNQLGYAKLDSSDQYRRGMLGAKQQELQQTGAYQQGTLQNQRDTILANIYKTELDARMKMGEQKLQERSGLSASFLKAYQQTKDPQMKQQIKDGYIDIVQKRGVADDNYINTLKNAPDSMLIPILQGDVAMNNNAVSMLDKGKTTSDQLIADANEARQAAGQAPLTSQEEADIKTNAAFKSMYANPLDAGLKQEDAKQAGKLSETRNQFVPLIQNMQRAKDLVENISSSQLGPTIDWTKLNRLDPKVQELTALLNDLALRVKDPVYKLGGGQGFTDQDRVFLTQIVGNTATNKTALLKILSSNIKIYQQQAQSDWDKENNIRKSAANETYYNDWLTNNPKPEFNTQSTNTQQPQILTFNPETGKLE